MFSFARKNASRISHSAVFRRLESSMKDARAARRAKLGDNVPRKPFFTRNKIIALGTIATISFVTHDIRNNRDGLLGSFYYGSPVERFVQDIYEYATGQVNSVFEPSSDALLPTWPTDPMYGNIPPGTPAPPLLVLDLEKTLIGSVYDPGLGWRHVKRPGLDKFLNSLNGYYEVVIFSENDVGIAQDILTAIDPENRCHKLGASAGEMRGTAILKRLDLMNRDISRIILIDDNPESFQLCPRNTLQVMPFTDIHNKHDTTLLDLIPLLQAFVHEECQDFRQAIDALGTHDAQEAAVEYRMRVSQKKQEEASRRNKGLGGLIRGAKPSEELVDDGFIQSSVLSPKDIVGSDPTAQKALPGLPQPKPHGTLTIDPVTGKPIPPPEAEGAVKGPAMKKKGALFAYLDDMEKSKEEDARRKNEKMNELYLQRQLAKQQKKSETASE